MSANPPRSAAMAVRRALQEWAHERVAGLLEATVAAGPGEAGAPVAPPTLTLDWGGTTVLGSRPVDIDDDAGAGVWLLHHEDVALAFVWRCNSLDLADLFAHEFVREATLAAVASNDDGNRVLHFTAEVDGQAFGGKLYLDGAVVPERTDENMTRSLYTYRVPGTVTYPVLAVEQEATGVMNIVVTINGTTYSLEEIVDA